MRHNRILHTCFRFILSRLPSFHLSCLPAFLLIVFLSNQFACQSTMICVSVCLCLSVSLSVCLSLCLCALLLTVFFYFCLPVCVSVCCVTLRFCWDFSEASVRTCLAVHLETWLTTFRLSSWEFQSKQRYQTKPERESLGKGAIEGMKKSFALYHLLSLIVQAFFLILLHLFTKCNRGFFIFRLSLCIPITFRGVQRSCLSSLWSSNLSVG